MTQENLSPQIWTLLIARDPLSEKDVRRGGGGGGEALGVKLGTDSFV